jgi:hypothetical protein
VDYLKKNVVVGFFESGSCPNAQVIMVLSRLLNFSEQDRARSKQRPRHMSNKYHALSGAVANRRVTLCMRGFEPHRFTGATLLMVQTFIYSAVMYGAEVWRH